MLFDLQGKRRRAVQATYLILAVLMGGGLVLFGVGSGSISGGLFDAITGNNSNGGGNPNSLVDKRVKADNKALALNPKNTTAMADLMRAHYQLATENSDQTTGQFDDTGKAELQKASTAWKRYVDTAKKVDPSLAGLMLNAYSEIGLNDPQGAAQAAQFVAQARPSAQAYIQLTTYAAKAGNTRLATLAGQKAVALAPKKQKKLVKAQVAAAQAGGAGGTTTSG